MTRRMHLSAAAGIIASAALELMLARFGRDLEVAERSTCRLFWEPRNNHGGMSDAGTVLRNRLDDDRRGADESSTRRTLSSIQRRSRQMVRTQEEARRAAAQEVWSQDQVQQGNPRRLHRGDDEGAEGRQDSWR